MQYQETIGFLSLLEMTIANLIGVYIQPNFFTKNQSK